MKVALLTPTPPDLSALGVRILSAILKRAGHECQLVFLPGGIEMMKYRKGFIYEYPQELIEQVVTLVQDAHLVGISFMSNYYDRAIQLGRSLKAAAPDRPLIMGGVHPTMRPKECLEVADLVCIGEGDETLLDLVQALETGKDPTSIPNLAFKSNGAMVVNPLRPLITDLDALPFYDYDLNDHFVVDSRSGKIVPVTRERLEEEALLERDLEGHFWPSYKTMSTRGCPHRCSYCAVSVYQRLYGQAGYLRFRSVEHVIRELEEIREKFPFYKLFLIFDDTFFAQPLERLTEFAEKYKTRIHLPFHAQCSPRTLTPQKLDLLIEAGMVFTEMGIQTGSETSQELYCRNVPNEKVLEAAHILNSRKGRMRMPCYHIILDNPWETWEDTTKTLQLLLQLPSPFWLKLSSLVLYPGTVLNERAQEEGILKDEIEEVCRKSFPTPDPMYLNLLIQVAGYVWFPRWLIKGLAVRPLVRLCHRPGLRPMIRPCCVAAEIMDKAVKGFRLLFRGEWSRIRRYLRRIK